MLYSHSIIMLLIEFLHSNGATHRCVLSQFVSDLSSIRVGGLPSERHERGFDAEMWCERRHAQGLAETIAFLVQFPSCMYL
jgi:hypothetical protein